MASMVERARFGAAALVFPVLLLLASCDDPNVSPSSGDITTTSPSATAVATPSPTPAAVASVAPAVNPPAAQDPYPAATAAGATAVCADGTWSFSQNRSGTCSHHGGVHWWTGNLGPAGPGAH
jgi:hypothetical protein